LAIVLLSPLFLQAHPAEASNPVIDIWWPADGAKIQGIQPFKGLLENYSPGQYSMYWQVDSGNPVSMNDNTDAYPHKEAQVDLTNWSWKGAGPYVITFTAKDSQGNTLSTATRTIYNSAQTSVIQSPVLPPSNPLAGKNLYFDSNSSAQQTINQLQSYDPYDATLLKKIASQPQAVWLGNWLSTADTAKTIQSALAAAKSQGAIATFVLYNIPQRDCGSFSAGGANNPAGYQSWVAMVASAIGSNQAIIILEPDALADITCLSQADQATRLSLLSSAVSTLKLNSNTVLYIDAGHPNWIASDTMSALLKAAGIARADGFSLNVSNYESTADNISYGTDLSQKTGNKHFVVDTSRNGNGSDGEWCNASGRALGSSPTTSTGQSLLDAFLWIKHPGESDGYCNGGPGAGVWWTSYAINLAKN
jgi:endoglucanase